MVDILSIFNKMYQREGIMKKLVQFLKDLNREDTEREDMKREEAFKSKTKGSLVFERLFYILTSIVFGMGITHNIYISDYTFFESGILLIFVIVFLILLLHNIHLLKKRWKLELWKM